MPTSTADTTETLFSHSIEEVRVGKFSFRLCLIRDLDEALEHYVKVSPNDTDKIPYFTRLWESAQALAEFVVEQQEFFAGRRVLELGCGLGLPALCAGKCGAQVTAADFHPDNRAFFLRNAALNGLTGIEYWQFDWRNPGPERQFEIILGSDLIYEKEMLEPLVACVCRYLTPGGRFFFADPGRNALQRAVTLFEQAGFSWELHPTREIFRFVFTRPEENG